MDAPVGRRRGSIAGVALIPEAIVDKEVKRVENESAKPRRGRRVRARRRRSVTMVMYEGGQSTSDSEEDVARDAVIATIGTDLAAEVRVSTRAGYLPRSHCKSIILTQRIALQDYLLRLGTTNAYNRPCWYIASQHVRVRCE